MKRLLAAILIVIGVCGTYFSSYAEISELHYQMLVQRYAELVEGDGSYLAFYGDSLTEGCHWENVYEGISAINLGCTGDTLYCLNIRLPILEAVGSCKTFVMGGINDLILGEDFSEIQINAESLFAALGNQQSIIYIQSVLPVMEGDDSQNGLATNEKIRQLNELLKSLCQSYDFTYIDMNPLFCDDSGQMKREYTTDGVHLTDEGYYCWWNAIEQYVAE